MTYADNPVRYGIIERNMSGMPNNEKGISRIDSGTTCGWFVRGYRAGKTHCKLFSDRKKGGKEKAFEAAKIYRDKLFDRLAAMPKVPRKRRIVLSDSRNNTGVLGVTRTMKKVAGGKAYEVFSVAWRPEPGINKCTSFSIMKYGEEKAFELAVSHRKKMIRKYYTPSEVKSFKEQWEKEDSSVLLGK